MRTFPIEAEPEAPAKAGASLLKRARFETSAIFVGFLLLTAALRSGVASADAPDAADLFYETVGISLAVGTVLGASTLPFYRDPSAGLLNVMIGAGAGFLVGVGIWAYQLFVGPSKPSSTRGLLLNPSWNLANRAEFRLLGQFENPAEGPTWVSQLPKSPGQVWLPIVSVTW